VVPQICWGSHSNNPRKVVLPYDCGKSNNTCLRQPSSTPTTLQHSNTSTLQLLLYLLFTSPITCTLQIVWHYLIAGTLFYTEAWARDSRKNLVVTSARIDVLELLTSSSDLSLVHIAIPTSNIKLLRSLLLADLLPVALLVSY
jgi:hypothetical protein